MTPLAATPAESPLALLDQRHGTRRARLELYPDRVTAVHSDLISSRRLVLPLDSLSPHVVVRHRGSVAPLLCSVVMALLALLLPAANPSISVGAILLGGAAWAASRRQYVVFPGQLSDLELFRDAPDSATARRFVAQVITRIEELQQELRAEERNQVERTRLDRVDELLRLRDLYAEGIIDRSDLGQAAEILARREQRRIGFRRP